MTHDELEAAVPLYAAGALERVETGPGGPPAFRMHPLSHNAERVSVGRGDVTVRAQHHASSPNLKRQDHVVPSVDPCR